MQNPTEQAEASIPTATTVDNDDPNMNPTVIVRRKAAKRTRPFDLAAGELHLVPSQSQAQDIPARKRPRLEETFSATTGEAARKTAPLDVSIGLFPHTAPNDANVNPVTDTQPNAGATTVTRRRWTLEVDAKLTSAVKNNSMRKCGKEYNINWGAVAALVPSRTSRQCKNRWNHCLDTNIDPTTARSGKWTVDEEKKLRDALQTHGGNNWEPIAALVPGRTKMQCRAKWHGTLVSNIDPTTARSGKWTADEDIKLKDAVQTHGDKDWEPIAALVTGRTKKQCHARWHGALLSSIDPTTARAGSWTADEDKKLRDAVHSYGGKNWGAIAALVTGRTKKQCHARWHGALLSSIDPTTARAGIWTADEDTKLKDAVHMHGGKNWKEIAQLVPGRTRTQCRSRWHDVLKPKIDRASGPTGK
jgi:hypothetical protein